MYPSLVVPLSNVSATRCASIRCIHYQLCRNQMYPLLEVLLQVVIFNFLKFFYFLLLILITLFNTASSASPQIPLLWENVGIEPRTVATLALSVRRCNHMGYSRSHPQRIHIGWMAEVMLAYGESVVNKSVDNDVQCSCRREIPGNSKAR